MMCTVKKKKNWLNVNSENSMIRVLRQYSMVTFSIHTLQCFADALSLLIAKHDWIKCSSFGYKDG